MKIPTVSVQSPIESVVVFAIHHFSWQLIRWYLSWGDTTNTCWKYRDPLKTDKTYMGTHNLSRSQLGPLSEKKLCIKISFWKLQIFWFFAKPQLNWKKSILINNIIRYAFYSKVATFTDFENIHTFFRQRHFFSEKPKTAWVFEKFFYFYCILRQICWKSVIKKINSQSFGQVQLAIKHEKTKALGGWMIFFP